MSHHNQRQQYSYGYPSYRSYIQTPQLSPPPSATHPDSYTTLIDPTSQNCESYNLHTPLPTPISSLTSQEEVGPYGAAPDTDMNLGGINFSELGRRYRITPIQSPTRGASFEGAYLSRLSLSPPLIVQLDCWDADGELTIPYDELPFLVCHLSLQRPDGSDASMVLAPEGDVVAMLYGTLVATPAEMNDREGAQGLYFAFPDVSVRYVGNFKLKASLHRITGGPPLDSTQTGVFEVVKESDYIAPHLTRHFDAQGVVRFGLPRSEW